jgi:hypothetical protein
LDQHRDPRICAEYKHPGGTEVMCLEKGEGPPLSSLAAPTMAGPSGFAAAMHTPQWRRWLNAIHAEVDGQQLAGCWHWTRLPYGASFLRNVLVPTTKLHVDFTVEREKARYCVDGSTEKPGEYADVCAHVAQLSTFKTQCACTAELKGKVYSGDWTQAYLCAVNTMPQYMREYASMLPKFKELGNRLVL